MTEETDNKLSVLLVEDDANTRTLLEKAVNEHTRLRIAAAVGTVEGGHRELDDKQPDVLLVDLGLPDGDGTELIREIYRRGYSTDVMVITVFGDERHVVRALEAGATGYILKDAMTDNICTSIMQLVDGGSPISAPIARHLLSRFHDSARMAAKEGIDLPQLTEREKDVLSQLSRGFSFPEIAGILSISPHTVASHVKHIYRKLAVRSRSEAVYEALQLGLIEIGR
ncbi:MAG: response regulator transcription factor [Gammaproteobacteria bacterium]|nr:response regulator transcription factor [Gammaproteobacteria bacterium]MCF6259860.1 response regulator transcription factor [Gammaproteobacteria bacterium]